MKKLLLFSVIILLLAACSKDEDVDPRESFVGQWSETYDYSLTYDTYQETSTEVGELTITKGSADNQIVINSDGELLNANVIDNTFTIPNQTVTISGTSGDINLTTSGSGMVQNGTLTYSMRMVGDGFNISISSTAYKK